MTFMRSAAPMEKFFIYISVPCSVSSKETIRAAVNGLYHPSACGVIRTTRAAKSHDSQSKVCGLGCSKGESEDMYYCFISILKSVMLKMARPPFLLSQCLLSLSWVLLSKYSFVPLARSFINLTYTLTSGALQKLPVKVAVGGELKQIVLCSCLRLKQKREGRRFN